MDPSIIQACARGFRARRDKERARHALQTNALRERAGAAAARLAGSFGAKRVWLFGSIAWSQAHDTSDVDLLVDGIEAQALPAAHAMAEAIIGAPVDLVRIEEAPPGLAVRVQQEGILLHGK
jgi:uncharacterized protein